jgi:hypothetical protein
LVKNQTNAVDNGVYVFNGSSSAMTRTSDMAVGSLLGETALRVSEGIVNAHTEWVVASQTAGPSTVGSTALNFVEQSYGVNVRNFGAKGDYRTVSDGVMNAGSATLTSATGSFSSADQNKSITVFGAGAGGTNLITTISNVTNLTTAALAATAATGVSGAIVAWGTDDTAALVAAATSAATLGGAVRVRAGQYLVASNVTLSVPLEFEPGGVIVVGNGVTSFVVNGEIRASDVQQIISGSANIQPVTSPSGGPTLTVTTPFALAAAHTIQFKMTAGGALGTAAFQYRFSMNGGTTWTDWVGPDLQQPPVPVPTLSFITTARTGR